MKLLSLVVSLFIPMFFMSGLVQAYDQADQQFEMLSKLKGDWKLAPASMQEGKTTQHKIVKPLLGTNNPAI